MGTAELTTAIVQKVVLITGGTGSFGRTMVEELLRAGCREIRIFSRDELKQEQMRQELNCDRLRFYLGDVRKRSSLDEAMHGVNLVFHAAALKQVPSCEFFPMEAVETNVAGSSNVIEAAIRHGAQSVVCLGTDKAVYPVNAMGMTKALMEKVAQAAARRLGQNETRVSCVRYGNVMYSRGSVIPLFVRQIKARQPITVTEPQMTRFMLPLAGSVELVKVALLKAQPGDIFIKKAAAAAMGTLVETLQLIFGTKLPVVTMGMRHGEKMHETLASAEELSRAEDLGDYYRIPMDGRDLNYSKYLSEGDPLIARQRDYCSADTKLLNADELRRLLLSLPEIQAELGGATV
ncbi:MAG: SDR family NAD(P)-dependent oxidoreductase [Planctomycetota bacterium]|nr:SDR family NAD(P)-dependent oxidoreductase [Blastopirellula sp.]